MWPVRLGIELPSQFHREAFYEVAYTKLRCAGNPYCMQIRLANVMPIFVPGIWKWWMEA